MYKTRGGDTVEIHEWNGGGTFCIKGTIYRHDEKTNFGHQKKEYGIWNTVGKARILEDHADDIIFEKEVK